MCAYIWNTLVLLFCVHWKILLWSESSCLQALILRLIWLHLFGSAINVSTLFEQKKMRQCENESESNRIFLCNVITVYSPFCVSSMEQTHFWSHQHLPSHCVCSQRMMVVESLRIKNQSKSKTNELCPKVVLHIFPLCTIKSNNHKITLLKFRETRFQMDFSHSISFDFDICG